MQDIIWAFSRTPPASDDKNSLFSIHHRIGRGTLNLTRIAPLPAQPPPPLPPPPPFVHHHSSESHSHSEEEEEEEEEGGGSASLVHGVLCMAGFLFVIPFGALVARYAKVTGSSRAFRLHRLLQFGRGSCLPIHPLTHSLICFAQLARVSREARSRISFWITTTTTTRALRTK